MIRLWERSAEEFQQLPGLLTFAVLGKTKTEQGLAVYAQLDKNQYIDVIQVTDKQFNAITIQRQRFHGDWNYQISSRKAA